MCWLVFRIHFVLSDEPVPFLGRVWWWHPPVSPWGRGAPTQSSFGEGMETSPLRCRPVAWANSRLLMTKLTKRNPTAVYSHCEAGGTGFLTIPLRGWSGDRVPSSLGGESFILFLFSCIGCIGLQVPPLETCCLAQSLCAGELGFCDRRRTLTAFSFCSLRHGRNLY